jgi:peptidoglycan/xylan/chitin deacetylase (PgdA/CDA1 family)
MIDLFHHHKPWYGTSMARLIPLRVLALTAFVSLTASGGAWAENCPGHPDALGTSRTLVVDPTEHSRIGTMQYPETLPLADHEVVLTFDDGPLPKHTRPILEMLDAQCIKATFFIVGQMANAYPQMLRDVQAAGHTIGTHTLSHPLRMNRMSIDQNKAEIDGGIAATTAALGDPAKVAPFLRIPGLLRSSEVEDYLTSKGIMTWSADFPADDWHRISPARVAQLAISRLEAKGRGVLLLHDIQQRTQTALPTILRELKARGYRIVHVVPATPDLPKTTTQPWQWHLHPVEPVIATDDGMRFSFAPQAVTGASKQTAMAGVPTISQKMARKGAMPAPIWASAEPSNDDALSLLLKPAPATFQFSGRDNVTHDVATKTSSATQ